MSNKKYGKGISLRYREMLFDEFFTYVNGCLGENPLIKIDDIKTDNPDPKQIGIALGRYMALWDIHCDKVKADIAVKKSFVNKVREEWEAAYNRGLRIQKRKRSSVK